MFNKPASTEPPASTVTTPGNLSNTVTETSTGSPQQPSSKKLLLIVSIIMLILAAAFGAYTMMQQLPSSQTQPEPTMIPSATPEPNEEAVFCTMDAKICPDGSSVGRVPPSCKFEACPGENTEPQVYSNQDMGFGMTFPADWPALNIEEKEREVIFKLPLQIKVAMEPDNPDTEYHTEDTIFTIIERSPLQDNERFLGTILATKLNGNILACIYPLDTVIEPGTIDESNAEKIRGDTHPCGTTVPAAFNMQ